MIHALAIALLMFGVAVATRGPIGRSKRATYTVDSGGTLTPGLGMIKGALDSSCTNPTGAGQRCLGIVDYSPFNFGVSGAAGGGGSIAACLVQEGECDAVCGAAVAAGDYVVMNATGQLITSTTTGDEVVGRARSSTVNAGDHFIVDVDPFIR